MYPSRKLPTKAGAGIIRAERYRASGSGERFQKISFCYSERGFSLIELMVGLVISLICIFAMLSVFAIYEGQKRTTTNGSDAQQSGSFSMYELERQVRTAGSGLVQGNKYGVWGCAVTAYTVSKQQLPATTPFPAPFTNWPATTLAVPVLIQSGGLTGATANPDIIAVIGGNSSIRTFKAGIVASTGLTVTLDNSLGVLASDYLLVPKNGANTCTVARSTNALPAANVVVLDATASPAAGFVGAYNAPGTVFDLGPSPTFSLFGVDNVKTNSLMVYDLLQRPAAGTAAVPPITIADGIVNLKALYGVNDGANGGTLLSGQVDEWVQPTGAVWSLAALTPIPDTAAAATARAQIKAIRIVVVARSQQPERAPAASATVQSSAGYIGYSGATTMTLFPDLALGLRYTIATLPQYRYKVYDTTIPIRNAFITQYY
jgi:type IV pilus assembly protein PilW